MARGPCTPYLAQSSASISAEAAFPWRRRCLPMRSKTDTPGGPGARHRLMQAQCMQMRSTGPFAPVSRPAGFSSAVGTSARGAIVELREPAPRLRLWPARLRSRSCRHAGAKRWCWRTQKWIARRSRDIRRPRRPRLTVVRQPASLPFSSWPPAPGQPARRQAAGR